MAGNWGVFAVAAATAGFLTCVAQPVGAATNPGMDLPALIAAASRIVHARAEEVTPSWDPSGTRIMTEVTFTVLEDLKAEGSATISVILPGGRIDPVEMRVPGVPSFQPGDEAVLFTTEAGEGRMGLLGLSQGVIRITGGETPDLSESLDGIRQLVLGVGATPRRSTEPEYDLILDASNEP